MTGTRALIWLRGHACRACEAESIGGVNIHRTGTRMCFEACSELPASRYPGIKDSAKNKDKKEAEAPPDLLCAHHKECH